MANHQPTPTDIDPASLTHAQKFWTEFTKYSTWSVLGIVVILILLALFVA